MRVMQEHAEAEGRGVTAPARSWFNNFLLCLTCVLLVSHSVYLHFVVLQRLDSAATREVDASARALEQQRLIEEGQKRQMTNGVKLLLQQEDLLKRFSKQE